ncbi:GNAT family N-acetyltransferase [Cohaesibacter haloalkalitolerans]|uniref:GNAT family N-acetyltransferase n=1 Tax=Cohaesibacter haloalkalitolerans TaxID=1162980 RepID=UPI000E6463A7|nr:GNAT family N-acetyltransferase [Cohaesibacter haloalkalitolerans]
MDESFRIVSLEDGRNAIPVIAQWFCDQWPTWYGPDGPGDAIADLEGWADGSGIPLARIALSETGDPMGIAALKPDGLGEELGLGPFLSAFYVRPDCRRRGVGMALTRAIEDAARSLGIASVYGVTDGARGLLMRAGWLDTGLTAQSERGVLPIFCRNLAS